MNGAVLKFNAWFPLHKCGDGPAHDRGLVHNMHNMASLAYRESCNHVFCCQLVIKMMLQYSLHIIYTCTCDKHIGIQLS